MEKDTEQRGCIKGLRGGEYEEQHIAHGRRCLSPFRRAVSEAHVIHVGRRIWNMGSLSRLSHLRPFAFRLVFRGWHQCDVISHMLD